MLSEQEILDIVRAEAIEYGGVQEVPGQKHGARHSYHSPKRSARAHDENRSGRFEVGLRVVKYVLRLVREHDGKLHWKD